MYIFFFFQEIIEFPCIKINADTCEIEDVFHQYIQPKEIPVITPFCTELTGIMQVNFKFIYIYMFFEQCNWCV